MMTNATFNPDHDLGETTIAEKLNVSNRDVYDWFYGGPRYDEVHARVQEYLDLTDEQIEAATDNGQLLDMMLEG